MEFESIAPVAVAGASVLLGVALCFAGYRLFKAVLALVGFMTGAILAGAVAAVVSEGSDAVVLVAAVVGGVLTALLFGGLLVVGVFLLGALGGGLLGGAVAASFSTAVQIGVVAGLALVGGIAALKLQRLMISLSTALLGAGATVAGVLHFSIGADATGAMAERFTGAGQLIWADWATLGAWGLLALVGGGFQLRGRKKKKRDD